MAVDSSHYSLNSLRSLSKAPKTPESLSLLNSQRNTRFHFVGCFYSSPDLPTRPCLLPACPTSFLTRLQISPQNFRGIPKRPSCFKSNTKLPAQFMFFSSHSFSLFLGLIVMVGWISLIGREGTLAQVCFPEFGAVRKDVKFDMLHQFSNTCLQSQNFVGNLGLFRLWNGQLQKQISRMYMNILSVLQFLN